MSESTITALDIAYWFLAKAKDNDKSLGHMKLQKLVYYAYGWYLAYYDKPLFLETVYAFRHGPAVKEVYDRFESFDRNPIVGEVIRKSFDADIEKILSDVWCGYAHVTEDKLRDITKCHSSWLEAHCSNAWLPVMSADSIQADFKVMAEKYS